MTLGKKTGVLNGLALGVALLLSAPAARAEAVDCDLAARMVTDSDFDANWAQHGADVFKKLGSAGAELLEIQKKSNQARLARKNVAVLNELRDQFATRAWKLAHGSCEEALRRGVQGLIVRADVLAVQNRGCREELGNLRSPGATGLERKILAPLLPDGPSDPGAVRDAGGAIDRKADPGRVR